MQRFYLQNFNEKTIIILKKNDKIYYQLIKVLRSQIGDKVVFLDGKNYYDNLFIIDEINKNEMVLKFVEKISKINKNLLNLNLYQAIPNKQEKIELILQKGTEVGYSNFYFYKSERSQKLNLSKNKIERFQKILTEATEQSQRNIIPSLIFLDKLHLENIKGQNLYFHTKNKNSKNLKNLKLKNQKINIFVGPEGGFSENEDLEFEKNNFQKIYLGDFVLRTETVGIVIGFFLNQY